MLDASAGIQQLRLRLSDRTGTKPTAAPGTSAAVALVLLATGPETEILLIERADRHGDPWSGHVAFPGGRRDAEDADLSTTAIRETYEEVGIDLRNAAEAIGALADVRAMSHRKPLDLLIRPFVYSLTHRPDLRLDHREVKRAAWVPIGALRDARARGVHRIPGGDAAMEFPALVYDRLTIWGLTYRMLHDLLAFLP